MGRTLEEKSTDRLERVNVSAKSEWLERLDDWSFENRIRSRSEAIRKLVDCGIGAWPKKEHA